MTEIIANLTAAPLEELLEYQVLLEREITKRRQETKKEAAKKIKELAKVHQLDLHTLFSGEENTKLLVKPKYQHPDNPQLQWTGRGKKPLWVAELLATGRSLESFQLVEL